MRPLAPQDLTLAARLLLVLPEAARRAAMARLIGEAEAADRFRKRAGRAHPLWGNGSLESAARAHPLAPPHCFSDIRHLDCMALALDALVAHRRANFRAQASPAWKSPAKRCT